MAFHASQNRDGLQTIEWASDDRGIAGVTDLERECGADAELRQRVEASGCGPISRTC
jgi:hypothetical protein